MDVLTEMRDPSEKSSSYFGNGIVVDRVNDLLNDDEEGPSISAIHSNNIKNSSFESIENDKMMIQSNKRGKANSLNRNSLPSYQQF